MADILKFTPRLVPRGVATPETGKRRRGAAEVVILPVVRIERHMEPGRKHAQRVDRPAGRSR